MYFLILFSLTFLCYHLWKNKSLKLQDVAGCVVITIFSTIIAFAVLFPFAQIIDKYAEKEMVEVGTYDIVSFKGRISLNGSRKYVDEDLKYFLLIKTSREVKNYKIEPENAVIYKSDKNKATISRCTTENKFLKMFAFDFLRKDSFKIYVDYEISDFEIME